MKKTTKYIIITLVVLIVLGAAAAALILTSPKDSEDDASSSGTVSESTEPALIDKTAEDVKNIGIEDLAADDSYDHPDGNDHLERRHRADVHH